MRQVLAGVMATAFGALGYYTGTKEGASEQNVVLPQEKSMPWEQENGDQSADYKYKVRRPTSRATLTTSIILRGTQKILPEGYGP
jgi:hypothetical protein